MRSGPLKVERYTNEQYKSCVLGEVENVHYFDLMTLNQIQDNILHSLGFVSKLISSLFY